MPIAVQDVAAGLIDRLGPVTAMQLQKLVYYCQAWHLARTGEPLFNDDIEAWPDGPVVYDLWNEHRRKIQVHSTKGDPHAATGSAADVLDFVADIYGDLPVQELVDATHVEAPYVVARGDLAPRTPSNRVITRASMMEYYRRLISNPAAAVHHAVSSAALEGISTSVEHYDRMLAVASGRIDEDAAVADLVQVWSARATS